MTEYTSNRDFAATVLAQVAADPDLKKVEVKYGAGGNLDGPFVLGRPVLRDPSGVLPLVPSDGENARRIVRHGLADVLRWLGEPVGPAPFEEQHAMVVLEPILPGLSDMSHRPISRYGGVVVLSSDAYSALLASLGRGPVVQRKPPTGFRSASKAGAGTSARERLLEALGGPRKQPDAT